MFAGSLQYFVQSDFQAKIALLVREELKYDKILAVRGRGSQLWVGGVGILSCTFSKFRRRSESPVFLVLQLVMYDISSSIPPLPFIISLCQLPSSHL